MSKERERRKPRGTSVSIQLTPNGWVREYQQLPESKAAIELEIARRFCDPNVALDPHIRRFGRLELQPPERENAIDFRIRTDSGPRWLELAEFAPLDQFKFKYDNATGKWRGLDMAELFVKLVKDKQNKCYGPGVILLIYQTDDRLFVAPPIVRQMPNLLRQAGLTFDAVYSMSPGGMVWEAWPGDPKDQGPSLLGNLTVGVLLK